MIGTDGLLVRRIISPDGKVHNRAEVARARSKDEEYKRAESPNLGATTSSNYGKTKPVIPDLTTAAANGKASVSGATIDSEAAADASSGYAGSLSKGVSAAEAELASRPGIQISAPAAPCSGISGEGLQAGTPKPARLIPNEEVIFGVALFFSRSKVASGSWHDLIGQSRSMMSANRPLISGQSSSSETVTFERIIEESCPGEQWKLGMDDIKYSALWILMAVEKVRGNQNDVRHLLNEGLNLAWNKLVNGKQCQTNV